MKNSFRQVKKSLKENGLTTFYYEADEGFFTAEIDEIKINNNIEYIITKCSISYYLNMIDTKAKTKQTLLRRLEKLFS